MYKKIGFVAVGVALLISPLFASAQSDVQAQIAALLAQIKQLQTLIAQLQGHSNASCLNLTNTLGPDDTDADNNGEVTKLQNFLVSEGVLDSSSVTGYFGPATQKAVQKWQAQHMGITSGGPDTTGYGYVGPKTKSAMAQGCGNAAGQTITSNGSNGGTGIACEALALRTACPTGYHYVSDPDTFTSNGCRMQNMHCVPDTTSPNTFSASPTSGAAPLSVSFSTTQGGDGYTVYFGDGQSYTFTGNDTPECAAPRPGDPPNPQCSTWHTSHTYTTDGTYTARLISTIPQCYTVGTRCQQTLGSVTITVGGTQNATFSASPTSGPAPLSVTFNAAPYQRLNFGDGTQSDIETGACGKDCTFVHTYTWAGIFTATSECQGTPCTTPTSRVTITVGGTNKCGVNSFGVSNECGPGAYRNATIQCYDGHEETLGGPTSCKSSDTWRSYANDVCAKRCSTPLSAPSISGLDAPTSLQVGQSGTWTVRVANPSASLGYSIVWGDEPQYALASTPVQRPTSPQSSATFTHTYQSAGTYTPTFTVSNDTGSSKTSATVNVGGISSTAGTLSVSNVPAADPNNSVSLATGGSTGVTVVSYGFKATGEAIQLNKIGAALGNAQAKPGDLSQITVWDGSTLVGTGLLVGYSTTITLSNPVTIPNGTSKVLTFKADIARIGSGQPGTPGDVIYLLVDPSMGPDTTGTGVLSGLVVKATKGDVNGTIPGVRIFRSYPTVALVSLPNDGLADGRLLRFKISANAAGSIGLAQIPVSISGLAANTNGQVDLYGYTDAYSSPIPGFTSGGINGLPVSSGSPGGYLWFPTPVEIPAGATYYFELRDSTKGTGLTNSTSLITTLPVQGNYSGLYSATSLNGKDVLFVWSPNDMTTSQFSDSDWTNGYGVPGLTAGAISQTRIGGSTPPVSGTYIMTVDGSVASTRSDMSQETALNDCQQYVVTHKGTLVSCTYNGAEIFTSKGEAPRDLKYVCSADGTHVTLSWDPMPGRAAGFLLRLDDPSNNSPSCVGGTFCDGSTDVHNEGDATTPFTTPVIPGRHYDWWMLSVSGYGVHSDTASGQSFTCPGGSGGGAQSADANSNLANALTALESVLQAIIQQLGR